MSVKLLFVDDDPNILSAFRRELRNKYAFDVAQGSQEALKVLETSGPYAVVISDLRMPHMDGVQFLSHVKDVSPYTIRLMLTGNADLEAAIAAVNKGYVFRFLCKPVTSNDLCGAIDAALEQYRLVTAERELLQKTLSGSVKVLIDCLSLVNPVAFSKSARMRRYVKHICLHLGIPNSWQFELAAMLSQIGCIAILPEVLEKLAVGAPLSGEERKMYDSHPSVGKTLLENIPRLESVAEMIGLQNESCGSRTLTELRDIKSASVLGAQILRVALSYDNLIVAGCSHSQAIAKMREKPKELDGAITDAMSSYQRDVEPSEPWLIPVTKLAEGMILHHDLKTNTGITIVAAGREMTPALLARIKCWADTHQIPELITVRAIENNSGIGSPSYQVDFEDSRAA